MKNRRRIPAIVPPSVTPSTAQNAWATPPPTPNNIPPMSKAVIEQSVVPSAASFLSSFSGTIAGLVVFGLIALIIYVVGKGCVRRKQKGYRKLSDKDEPEEPQIRGISSIFLIRTVNCAWALTIIVKFLLTSRYPVIVFII